MSTSLDLPAELTIYAVADTRQRISDLLPAVGSKEALTIDCAQLREIDAAGIQLLLSLDKIARQQCRPIAFESIPGFLAERLHIIGADSLLATGKTTAGAS